MTILFHHKIYFTERIKYSISSFPQVADLHGDRSAFSICPAIKEDTLMHRFSSLCLTLFLLVTASLCQAQDVVRVDAFFPQGTIKNVRQVTARFSEAMTTFGDLRNESTFGIACPEKGSGRWVDVKNWAYDFDRDLAAGVSCSLTLLGVPLS
jgi:hypothetical protein